MQVGKKRDVSFLIYPRFYARIRTADARSSLLFKPAAQPL